MKLLRKTGAVDNFAKNLILDDLFNSVQKMSKYLQCCKSNDGKTTCLGFT